MLKNEDMLSFWHLSEELSVPDRVRGLEVTDGLQIESDTGQKQRMPKK